MILLHPDVILPSDLGEFSLSVCVIHYIPDYLKFKKNIPAIQGLSMAVV